MVMLPIVFRRNARMSGATAENPDIASLIRATL
jgi:hypothetical protein